MLRCGLAFVLVFTATSACSHAVSTAAVSDAQLGARVKTALVEATSNTR